MDPMAIVPKGGRGINSAGHVARGRRGFCFPRFGARRTPWVYPMANFAESHLADRPKDASFPEGYQGIKSAGYVAQRPRGNLSARVCARRLPTLREDRHGLMIWRIWTRRTQLRLRPKAAKGIILWQTCLAKGMRRFARKLPIVSKAAGGLNPFIILPKGREGIYPLALAPEGYRFARRLP